MIGCGCVNAIREDKDVSSWAPKELENALAEFVTPVKVNGSDASFVVKEVEKCDGSVTIIISRGKVSNPGGAK